MKNSKFLLRLLFFKKRPRYVVWWCCIHNWTKAIHWCSIRGHHNITIWDKIQIPMQNAKKLQHLVALSTFSELRRIHTRGFASRACSRGALHAPGTRSMLQGRAPCARGTFRGQSSSVCINYFIGILYPWEQNFHPAKCSSTFNRLNIWKLPRHIERTWKRSLACSETFCCA